MDDDNEEHRTLARLMERHPKLFHGEPPRVMSDLSPGWFALVDQLCSDLEAILGERCDDFVVDQVKEKFGGLRFYWSLRGAKPTIEMDVGGAKSAPGEAAAADGYVERFTNTPMGLRVSIRPDDALSAAIAARIQQAEEASFTACEECGQPGVLLVKPSGWLYTACQQHQQPGSRPYESPEDMGGVP
jgi:hypothetical protein